MVVKALGEIVLRTAQMQAMHAFYERVVGLEPMLSEGDYRFFRVGEGFAGHTQVIALFAATIAPNHGDHTWADPDLPRTTLHHIALAIDRKDFDAEKARLESLGYTVSTADHHWVK
jgi:catechol-2,3-dioxygenase